MASIRERSSGGAGTTWQVLYRHGNKQASRTFRDAKKAERFRQMVDLLGPDKALAELFSEGMPDRLTVDDLAVKFLESKKGDVTPRTLEDYHRDYENWIKPWFGHRAAESIDEGDVQEWVDHMARTLAPKSVGDRHMLLHSMYRYGKAKTRRLVSHNPCLETELPKKKRSRPKGTTVAEWRAILNAAHDKGNHDAADLILFIGTVGWRWSEAAALGVRDVEDDGEVVHVNVTRVFRLVEGRQVLVEDEAKTYAGFRRVPVAAEAAAMLRRRLVGKAPGDFVFTNSRGNHWNQNTFLRNTWPSLVKAANLGERRPTPHWLRHMAVAVMAAAGVPMHEIQRTIGHDDLATTNKTYGGMVNTLSRTSLANIDAILSGNAARGTVVAGEVVQGVVAELG